MLQTAFSCPLSTQFDFNPDSASIHSVVSDLIEQGYSISDDLIPYELCKSIYQHIIKLPNAEFKSAEVGQGISQQRHSTIRSDSIVWLEDDASSLGDYYRYMDQLRTALSRQLLICLPELEAHVARYAAGAFYKKHLDNFKGNSLRTITTVLYLNPNWQEEFGGELLMYHPQQNAPFLKVVPQFGRIALFMSERFPHEVLPASKDRYSIACWFRQRPLVGF